MPLTPRSCEDDQSQDGCAAAFHIENTPVRRSLEVLRKRADFLAAARALRHGTQGFLLQARPRRDEGAPRVGFTCSKKLGNAVARNRAKRRLREVARLTLPELARPGWDYVLIGRPGVTAERDFKALCNDLRLALNKVHR